MLAFLDNIGIGGITLLTLAVAWLIATAKNKWEHRNAPKIVPFVKDGHLHLRREDYDEWMAANADPDDDDGEPLPDKDIETLEREHREAMARNTET